MKYTKIACAVGSVISLMHRQPKLFLRVLYPRHLFSRVARLLMVFSGVGVGRVWDRNRGFSLLQRP